MVADIDIPALASLADALKPDILDALRNCVTFWVEHWYIGGDGSVAKVKPDSPVWLAIAAVERVGRDIPSLLTALESERTANARLREECERLRGESDARGIELRRMDRTAGLIRREVEEEIAAFVESYGERAGGSKSVIAIGAAADIRDGAHRRKESP